MYSHFNSLAMKRALDLTPHLHKNTTHFLCHLHPFQFTSLHKAEPLGWEATETALKKSLIQFKTYWNKNKKNI